MRLRDLPKISRWFLVKALKHILNQDFSALVHSWLDGSGRHKKFSSIHAPYPWTPRAVPSSHAVTTTKLSGHRQMAPGGQNYFPTPREALL